MRIATVLLVLMFGVSSASAAPASAESIEALFAITQTEALVNGIYADVEKSMDQQIAQVISRARPNESQRRALEAIHGEILAAMKNDLSWTSLKPAYIQIYQESLTQEEVDGLLDFYRTPSGQALINKVPKITRRALALSQERVKPLVVKLISAMEQTLR